MTKTETAGAAPETPKAEPEHREPAFNPRLRWVAPIIGPFRRWRRRELVATIDQVAVLTRVQDEGLASPRYVFMLAMSGGIAILGLLLSSPAVVIGAMLISPLMGPIIAFGFALATGDLSWMRRSGKSLAMGTLAAVLFCALIVALSPLQTVTPEIAARTRPNLFDLAIALFSALAGSYAMIRGREGAIVGVAIATALMPPLAVVGFGLATFNWTVFSGALMLYVTNLVTIALTATVMARFYGFHSLLTERQTLLQSAGILVSFVLLGIPLAISLRQIAWEANASRMINGFIKDEFDPRSRISQMDIDFDSKPISVSASVLTPRIVSGVEDTSNRALTRLLGVPVKVNVDQFRVGTSATDAEQAQLAAALAKKQEDEDAKIKRLVDAMALVSGVPADEIMVDREHRRIMVNAEPVPQMPLIGYLVLEHRVAALAPEWNVALRPPAAALPDIPVSAVKLTEGDKTVTVDKPTDKGSAAVALIGWAVKRIGAPVRLSGRDGDEIDAAADALRAEHVTVLTEKPDRKLAKGTVEAQWASPAEAPGGADAAAK